MLGRYERFLRFALVGVAGFLVDASVVAVLIRVFAIGPYQARIGSYLFAVTTTWWLNRRFTFRSTSPPARELAAFALTNALGALVNLSVYAAIIAWCGSLGWIPVAAVAVGSLMGLCINFLLSSKIVFSARATLREDSSRLS
jgi:putative flippase GtrA